MPEHIDGILTCRFVFLTHCLSCHSFLQDIMGPTELPVTDIFS